MGTQFYPQPSHDIFYWEYEEVHTVMRRKSRRAFHNEGLMSHFKNLSLTDITPSLLLVVCTNHADKQSKNQCIFYLELDVSETGLCLRLYLEPNHLGPVDIATLCFRTPATTKPIVILGNQHNTNEQRELTFPNWVFIACRRRQNPVSENLFLNKRQDDGYRPELWLVTLRYHHHKPIHLNQCVA
jgi:hypothetical protein